MAEVIAGFRAERRQPSEVRNVPSGPSAHGSTFWARVMHCPREHLLANILKWRSLAPNDPLDLGVIWHWALEAYYDTRYRYQQRWLKDRNLPVPQSREQWYAFCDWAPMEFWRAGEPEAQRAMYAVFRPFAGEPGYGEIYDACIRMTEVYLDAYRMDRWYILAVEPVIELPEEWLGFPYSSRLDLAIVNGATKAYHSVEHKSAYAINLLVTDGYTQDSQVIGQVVCCRFGVPADTLPPYCGGIVNITSKTKRPQIDRVTVAPPDAALYEWIVNMRQENHVRLHVMPAQNYPKRYGSCGRRFGRCPFFYFCRDSYDVTADDLKAGFDLEPYGFKQGNLQTRGAEIED